MNAISIPPQIPAQLPNTGGELGVADAIAVVGLAAAAAGALIRRRARGTPSTAGADTAAESDAGSEPSED